MERAVPDRVLDCLGQYCPMPVLLARQAIDEMAAGQVLEVVVNDRAAEEDIPRWAKRTGHSLVYIAWDDGRLVFQVRKEQ